MWFVRKRESEQAGAKKAVVVFVEVAQNCPKQGRYDTNGTKERWPWVGEKQKDNKLLIKTMRPGHEKAASKRSGTSFMPFTNAAV